MSAPAYIPGMSCEDFKRAHHRQCQAAYEARLATAIEAEQFLAGYRRRHCDAIERSSRRRDASRHAAGNLIVHGANLGVLFERAAGYVDRVLKGARPADLPVQLATEFELIINLKTAAALGLNIPPAFIARADEVIE